MDGMRFQLHLWQPKLTSMASVTIEAVAESFLEQIGYATGVWSSPVRIYDNYKDEQNKVLTGIIVPFPNHRFGPNGQTGLIIKPYTANMKSDLKKTSFNGATFAIYLGRFQRVTENNRVLSAKYFARELFFTTVSKEVRTGRKISKFEGNYDCQSFGRAYSGWTLMEGKKAYLDICMNSKIILPLQYNNGNGSSGYTVAIRYGSAVNETAMKTQVDTYDFFDGFIVNDFADGEDFNSEDDGVTPISPQNIAGLRMFGVCIEPGNGMVRDKFDVNNLDMKLVGIQGKKNVMDLDKLGMNAVGVQKLAAMKDDVDLDKLGIDIIEKEGMNASNWTVH